MAIRTNVGAAPLKIREPVQFKGVPGSPYTRKMLAYLRYRHIRYELLIGNQADSLSLPQPKVNLLPTFFLPNAQNELEAVVDSTPLIRRFEADFTERAAIPEHPVLAFLNYLIEDCTDEWLTNAMFHYRWHYDADIKMAGTILPRWSGNQAPEEQLQAGQAKMETTIAGSPWAQPTFPYQARCLQWINKEYRKLDSGARDQVDAVLGGTGCDSMIFQ